MEPLQRDAAKATILQARTSVAQAVIAVLALIIAILGLAVAFKQLRPGVSSPAVDSSPLSVPDASTHFSPLATPTESPSRLDGGASVSSREALVEAREEHQETPGGSAAGVASPHEPPGSHEAEESSERERAGSPRPREVREQAFRFVLNGCFHSGSEIRCELLITNTGPDRELLADSARLVDQSGNELTSHDISLGASESSGVGGRYFMHAHAQLTSNVPIRAAVRFQGASPQATTAKLLEVGFEGKTVAVGGFTGRTSSDRGVRIRFQDVPFVDE